MRVFSPLFSRAEMLHPLLIMQVEELPTIYGNGLVCFGPFQDVSKNIARLWTAHKQTEEEPMVIF